MISMVRTHKAKTYDWLEEGNFASILINSRVRNSCLGFTSLKGTRA
jgi:hypothetical protein